MKQNQKPNHPTEKDNLAELIFASTTKALDYFPFTLFTLSFLSFRTLSEAEHGLKGRLAIWLSSFLENMRASFYCRQVESPLFDDRLYCLLLK